MADNVTITPGTGVSIAGDDVGGNIHQRVKVTWGVDGVGNDTNATTPLPTAQTGALPAGTNNIGDVDVLTLPALPAGTNNIGDVDVLTLPAIPAGTNSIGKVVPIPQAAVNGSTASRVNAAASTNATNLKASAGNVFGIHVFNVAAYDVFLKLYDKASSPTVGTDTPVWTIPVKAGGGFSANFPLGTPFPTGVSYAITKLQADSDTTVVVAGDLTGRITWM